MGLQARNVEDGPVLPEIPRSKNTVIWHSLGTPAIILHDHEENKAHGTLWLVHAGGTLHTKHLGLRRRSPAKKLALAKTNSMGPK